MFCRWDGKIPSLRVSCGFSFNRSIFHLRLWFTVPKHLGVIATYLPISGLSPTSSSATVFFFATLNSFSSCASIVILLLFVCAGLWMLGGANLYFLQTVSQKQRTFYLSKHFLLFYSRVFRLRDERLRSLLRLKFYDDRPDGSRSRRYRRALISLNYYRTVT